MIELLEGMIQFGEGNISLFEHRVNTIKDLLIQYKPQYIVEIGFNLGHSCKLIIDTLQSIENYNGIKKFYVFDICEGVNNNVFFYGSFHDNIGGAHNYVKPNFEILKNHYNLDMQLIEGDSIITVKPFIDNIEHELDFIEVDGFHQGDHPKYDILNTITKLKKGGVLYIDDYNSNYPDITNAIDTIDWSKFETHKNNDIFYAVKN